MEQRKPISRALHALGLGDLGFVGKWVGLSTIIGVLGGVAAVGYVVAAAFLRVESS